MKPADFGVITVKETTKLLNPLHTLYGSGTTTRTYDALGRTTSKDVPGVGLSKYQYDVVAGILAGHTAETATDPKGNAVTREYDRAGRLCQVRSGLTRQRTRITPTATGKAWRTRTG